MFYPQSEQMLQEPEWQALTAVQNGSYTFLPKENFHYKPNAAWAKSYALLCGGGA
jgi:iron complex transport system substrate-binding protein